MTIDNSTKQQPDIMSNKDVPKEEMERLQQGVADSNTGTIDNTRKQ